MKRAIIIFPDEWLSYSPSTLNLISCLKSGHEVTVVAINDGSCDNNIDIDGLILININPLLKRFLCKFRLYSYFRLGCLLYQSLFLTKTKFNIVIGVDPIGFIVAKLFSKSPILFSLEIGRGLFFKLMKFLKINRVIIQSEERMKYLFGNEEPNISYIQNAPIFPDLTLDKILAKRSTAEKNLIFLGNIMPAHGVERCIEALNFLSDEYSLTLKGIIKENFKKELLNKYYQLIKLNRLKIDSSYTAQDEIVNYLIKYYIGFCFYDDYIIRYDFNYASCPSGKVFNYYAAGIPVIGHDIIGLQSVKKYNCGILISDPNPKKIADAVITVDKNYQEIMANALKSAKIYDFKQAFDNFIKDYYRTIKH